MKKLSVGVMMAISMIGIAHADNNNWTGIYAGVNMGVAYNDAQLTSQHLAFTSPNGTCNTSSNFSNIFSGAQVGYLHQFPNAVVSGIEANATINNNQNQTLGCNSKFNPAVFDSFTFRNQLQTSIKARLGRAQIWNEKVFLPYVTAGASVANVSLKYENEAGNSFSNSSAHLGWLIGAGIEWAFMQHWSLRAEYSYVDYGNVVNLKIPTVYALNDSNGGGSIDLSSNNVVLAINYWI